MANEFIARNGLISQNNSQITGSFSQGQDNIASGDYSHAQGSVSVASGSYSHAEGEATYAIGGWSHAEGTGTKAIGEASHAEGQSTTASADFSHAEGNFTVASGIHQHVQGTYNRSSSIQAAFIHGNGTSDSNRSNLIFAHDYIIEITGSLALSSGSVVISSSNLPPATSSTIPFTDDYNRATLSPGGTPSLTYTNTNTGTGNATISGSAFLNIANGLTAGQSYTSVPLSGFSAPFNPTLASNGVTSSIEWTFNLRTNRGSIFSGFGAGQYGGAVVLVGSSATFQNAGNGYALVYGTTTTRNWKLVRYTGGLSGTQTDVISGGTFASNTSYVSARIVYTPATNTWTYYFRDDGTGGWGDPTTVTTLVGSAVDSTYTSTLMNAFGVFFNYSTAASQNLQFDNLRVQQTITPLATAIDEFTIKNYAGTKTFNVADDGTTTTLGNVSVSGSITSFPSAAGNGFSGSFSGSYIGNGSSLILGQSGIMITGSAALTVTSATTALTLIPGLTTTITVPTQSLVYIQTNGGVNTTGTGITSGSALDVAILVDGAVLTAGGYQRMYADNPTGNATVTNWVSNWNTSVVLQLATGSHSITVNAVYVAGSTSTVSGGAGAIKQGTLSIMTLKNI